MPSSWSPSLRFELQYTGENINLWGDKLNAALTRVDNAIAGWTTKALTGNYVLSTANGAADEARSAMLKFTGAGPFTVTIPSVSKSYTVWNACSGALTITTGAGSAVTLGAGDLRLVFCDGASVKDLGFSGSDLKTYIDTAVATAAYSVGTFGVAITPNENGKLLTNNGVVPSWTSSLSGMSLSGLTVTGGMSVTGGIDQTGGTKGNVVSISGTDIDVAVGEYRTKSISANTSFTFSNTAPGKWSAVLLELVTSGNAQPSFAGARWTSGTAPTLQNGTHLIGLLYSGAAWSAVLVLDGSIVSAILKLVAGAPVPLALDYALVGGGGAGGQHAGTLSAGGGGGGVLQGSARWNSGSYNVTVGAGGQYGFYPTQVQGSGGNTTLVGPGVSLAAIGGGAGASGTMVVGSSGGSGGGSGQVGAAAPSGTAGQGNAGGACIARPDGGGNAGGGGGGAGAVGGTYTFDAGQAIRRAGAGGDGVNIPWLGYVSGGGGGGGGEDEVVNGGSGGAGGGASGGRNGVGGSGGTNTGGGGGGGGKNSAGTVFVSGAGGSGIVALRVLTVEAYRVRPSGSYTTSVSGSYTVFKFTASGAFTIY